MNKCIYCNKEAESYIMVKSRKKGVETEYPCCSLKCFNKAERFFKNRSVALWIFIPMLIVYLTIVVLSLFNVIPRIYNSVAGIVFGLVFIIFPYDVNIYATYQCIKTNKLCIRIVGGILIFMGIIALW